MFLLSTGSSWPRPFSPCWRVVGLRIPRAETWSTNRLHGLRQSNREFGPPAGLALNVDFPAVRPDNLPGRRQTEACPTRLGRVERAEQLAQVVRLDSLPGVNHVQQDAV